MNSNSSPNSTENSSIISESLKERALSLIKDENINEKKNNSLFSRFNENSKFR